jgi:hypothetical protein
MKIALALLASGLLSIGCCSSGRVVPDQAVPHQLAREVCVEVWARRPDGQLERVKVKAPAGWWLASDQVVSADPR